MVSVSTSPTKINVSASVAGIDVSLSQSPVVATMAAVGGPGPQGPQGPQGSQGPPGPIPEQSLSALLDVTLHEPQQGDLLRYSSGAWTNYGEKQITDGGNF